MNVLELYTLAFIKHFGSVPSHISDDVADMQIAKMDDKLRKAGLMT